MRFIKIMKNLETKIVGEVINKSGELLIIDPGYLRNFDPEYEKFMDNYEIIGVKRASAKQNVELFKKLYRVNKRLMRLDCGGEEIDSHLREQIKISKKRVKELANLLKEPKCYQPYLGTGREYVVIWTGTDGDCDIVQYPDRFYLSMNEIRGKEKEKIVGNSCMDTATLVVVDNQRYNIEKEIDKRCYTIVQAEPGIYEARFLSKGFKVRLQKKE